VSARVLKACRRPACQGRRTPVTRPSFLRLLLAARAVLRAITRSALVASAVRTATRFAGHRGSPPFFVVETSSEIVTDESKIGNLCLPYCAAKLKMFLDKRTHWSWNGLDLLLLCRQSHSASNGARSFCLERTRRERSAAGPYHRSRGLV